MILLFSVMIGTLVTFAGLFAMEYLGDKSYLRDCSGGAIYLIFAVTMIMTATTATTTQRLLLPPLLTP
jgi:small neutral amino acid transporter SnatA (MarC family)